MLCKRSRANTQLKHQAALFFASLPFFWRALHEIVTGADIPLYFTFLQP